VSERNHGLRGLDHVILSVHDLDGAMRDFAALGFTLSAPGLHPTRGTRNACIMLPNGYIELLSPAGPECREAFLLEFLAQGEGPSAVALAPWSTDDIHPVLAAQGAAMGEPVIGQRLIVDDGGAGPVRFKVQRLHPDTLLPGRCFLCEHLDRDRVFAPAWLSHANGAAVVTGLALTAGPAPCPSDALAAALGLAIDRTPPGEAAFTLGETRIACLDAAAARRRYGTGHRHPRAAVLELRIAVAPEHARSLDIHGLRLLLHPR